MGMTEKNLLISQLTMLFVEDYNLNLSEVKSKLADTFKSYRINLNTEEEISGDLSTEYLFRKFSESKLSIGMTTKTIQQYKIAVNKLEEITGKQLSDIEGDDINSFLRIYGKNVSDITLRSKYQLLSSVYNFLYSHKYISFNPVQFTDPPKATVIYKKPLTELELEKIKNVCEKLPLKESLRNMAIIHFFVSTGCRVSELCKVKMEDLDLDNKICKVKGKGKKERPVVLTDKACYRIKLYLETRENISPASPLFAHIRGDEIEMTKDGVERMLQKLKKNSGVENLTCHTFRRFYATELRRRGVNIQMIATSLGHANLNQINRYSLYNQQELIDTIRKSM